MEVKFYHNAPDRLRAACAITAKAVRAGHKVIVFAPVSSVAKQYDALLWTYQPLAFVPHVSIHSPLAPQTLVLIVESLNDLPYDDLLINLADDLPVGHARFHILVEIVTDDEAGRAAARKRWRYYKENSHAVQAHDLAKPQPS